MKKSGKLVRLGSSLYYFHNFSQNMRLVQSKLKEELQNKRGVGTGLEVKMWGYLCSILEYLGFTSDFGFKSLLMLGETVVTVK